MPDAYSLSQRRLPAPAATTYDVEHARCAIRSTRLRTGRKSTGSFWVYPKGTAAAGLQALTRGGSLWVHPKRTARATECSALRARNGAHLTHAEAKTGQTYREMRHDPCREPHDVRA